MAFQKLDKSPKCAEGKEVLGSKVIEQGGKGGSDVFLLLFQDRGKLTLAFRSGDPKEPGENISIDIPEGKVPIEQLEEAFNQAQTRQNCYDLLKGAVRKKAYGGSDCKIVKNSYCELIYQH